MDLEEREEKKEMGKFTKPKSESFKVLNPFTLDKHYRKNSIFESSDRKLIKKLLNENFIK